MQRHLELWQIKPSAAMLDNSSPSSYSLAHKPLALNTNDTGLWVNTITQTDDDFMFSFIANADQTLD